MNSPPPGWGLSSLTAFFDNARENQYATFHHKPIARDLAAIDKVLRKLLDGQVDPTPIFPMQFLLRSHSCFRAAASCAMAGQVYEATVLQRSALESAAYGLFIGPDRAKGVLWLSRHDSKSATDRVRKEFGFGNLSRFFEHAHPTVAPAFVSLYEISVDFGAHPNEAGFSISTNIRAEGGKQLIDTVYLHEDGMPLDFGLKNVARVGLWTIVVIKEIYPELYASSGVDTLVDSMIQKY